MKKKREAKILQKFKYFLLFPFYSAFFNSPLWNNLLFFVCLYPQSTPKKKGKNTEKGSKREIYNKNIFSSFVDIGAKIKKKEEKKCGRKKRKSE